MRCFLYKIGNSFMSRTINFGVSPRLAALLGETYRSTEAALKELVDNAWDADANRIEVALPEPMTTDPIVISDDGHGMTPDQIEREYLEIARDRRSVKGTHTPQKGRRVKGRKGIGKFSGLAAARYMEVVTVRDGTRSSLKIDKKTILDASDDLEEVPLPLTEEAATGLISGTKITLTHLDQALNFPSPEALRALLIYEYGRSTDVTILVNGRRLDVEDLPGETVTKPTALPHAGNTILRLTIAEGRSPKNAGIVLRVGGKVVGKPQWFGLDESPDIPESLRKRVYGEIEVDEGIEGVVTSDWGALVENSKAYKEIAEHVKSEATAALKRTFARDMKLHQNRLNQEINRRLSRLPEHRRTYAEAAIGKLLVKFYGERQDRIDTLASVILDAMERDEYFQVLEKIDAARHGDVANFAEALASFGLVELALMAERAKARQRFLDELDALAANTATLEAQMHTALDKNLWVLGAPFHLMSSNATLNRIVSDFANKKYQGLDATKRPDLLLNTDPGDRFLLIEFKRPSHAISRQDEAQAQEYADKLSAELPGKPFDLLVIRGKRAVASNAQNDPPNLKVASYSDIISRARHEVEWLLRTAFP
jgi:hypothetical protein